MPTQSITIGDRCLCQVGRNTVAVEVTAAAPDGGWVVATGSGRSLTIRNADRLRPVTPPPAPAATPRRGRAKGAMSGLAAAAKVLAETGEPLGCQTITERAIAQGYWAPEGKTPAATVYAAMLREIQQKGDAARFRKVARGRFALAQ